MLLSDTAWLPVAFRHSEVGKRRIKNHSSGKEEWTDAKYSVALTTADRFLEDEHNKPNCTHLMTIGCRRPFKQYVSRVMTSQSLTHASSYECSARGCRELACDKTFYRLTDGANRIGRHEDSRWRSLGSTVHACLQCDVCSSRQDITDQMERVFVERG